MFTVVGKAGARALARWLITHQNVLKVEIESTGKRAVINE
ncbi:hypothetical protein 10RS306A_gene4580 [Ralstonia phage 10RS306A]|uniref:Uncharacterized protein n=1 Tax=Ralstonia phage 10RS306A TaxID=2968818 RepID=A0A977TEI0_9CAUD|nr:hypothetical protein 10RS306A_gene4580 [Ralstonia phage 10RS306A]